LRVGGHLAERSLESDSCEELVRAAAWLIAVAIDPTVHDHEGSQQAAAPSELASAADGSGSQAAQQAGQPRHGDSPPREPARADAAPPGAASAQPRVADEARGDARWRPRYGRVGLLAGASFGTAAGAQAELGGSGGLGLNWLYSELELSVLLPRQEQLAADAVVRSWSLRFGLRECVLWGTQLRWGPCATLDGVRTVGHAEGLSTNQPDQALFWAVAGLALRVAWILPSRLELALAGGVGVPISPRPRFTVEGVGEVAPVSVWPGYVRIGFGFATR
jgi:hypothetical protein